MNLGLCAAACLLIGSMVGGGAGCRETKPPPPVPATPTAPRALAPWQTGRPARAVLAELSAATARLDEPQRSGVHIHVHFREWTEGSVHETHLWRRSDGSDRYPVGIERPSAQPAVLGGQIDFRRQAAHRNTIEVLAELFEQHCLGPAHRAAALRVLADTDGLHDLGEVSDRAGRAGVAIALFSGGTRDVLVFESATGTPLGYEKAQHAGHAGVTSHVTFLSCEHTDLRP